jgi:actin-related protein 10
MTSLSSPLSRSAGAPWAVIVDIGSSYLRCGFAGESKPRHCVSLRHTLLGKALVGSISWSSCSALEWKRYFLYLVHQIFFKYLEANPHDRAVVVCDKILYPRPLRSALAAALFHLNVPSVLFWPSETLCLIPLEVPTALVVDVGFSHTRVIPVFAGFIQLHAVRTTSTAGRTINKSLKKYLQQPEASSFGDPEVLKAKCVFFSDNSEETTATTNTSEISYEGNLQNRVSQEVEQILFNDVDDKAVPAVILDSLVASTVDSRCLLTQNILLTGGTAAIPGFANRLMKALMQAINENPAYSSLKGLREQFHVLDTIFPVDCLAWIGGAVIGCVEHEEALTVAEYRAGKKPLDWTRLHKGTNRTHSRPKTQK